MIPGAKHEIYEQHNDDRTLDQIDDFFFSFFSTFSHPIYFLSNGTSLIHISAEIFFLIYLILLFRNQLAWQTSSFSAGLAEKASKGQKFRIPEQHGYSY